MSRTWERVETAGYLAGAPEIRFDHNGKEYAQWRQKADVWEFQDGERRNTGVWYNVRAYFGAQNHAQYLTRGSLCFVRGKPNRRLWTNEKGEEKLINSIIATEVEYMDDKSRAGKENALAIEMYPVDLGNDPQA